MYNFTLCIYESMIGMPINAFITDVIETEIDLEFQSRLEICSNLRILAMH